MTAGDIHTGLRWGSDDPGDPSHNWQGTPPALWRRLLSLVLTSLLALPSPAALAALVIPQMPMLGSSATPAVPNLMVLLDNSSSMLMEMMPAQDSGAPWGTGDGGAYNQAGLYSPLCNSLFYSNGNNAKPLATGASTDFSGADPNAYPLPPRPVDPTGVVTYPPLPQPDFAAAPVDGFAPYLANPANPSQTGWKPSYQSYGLNTTNWTQSPQPVVAYDPAAQVNLGGALDANNKVIPFSLLTVSPRGYGASPVPRAGSFFWFPKTAGAKPTSADCLSAFTTLNGVVAPVATTGGNWVWQTIPANLQPSFARWYSYYRSRMNVMKVALGTTFASAVSGGLNVGLLTTTTVPIDPVTNIVANNSNVPPTTQTESTAVPVSAYAFKPPVFLDPAGQAALLAKAYGQSVPQSSFTYLMAGLSRVGQYYAGRPGIKGSGYTYGMLDSSGKPDPIQASCQRNYTLLATDGLYNDWGYQGTFNGGSLSRKSFDTPPGESLVVDTHYDGRDGNWPQPFPDPQAYKPFDDTISNTRIDCDPSYNSTFDGYDIALTPGKFNAELNRPNGTTYSTYVLDSLGNEVDLPTPLAVPRDADHQVANTPYTNTYLSEYWISGNLFTGLQKSYSGNITNNFLTGSGAECPSTDGSGSCKLPVLSNQVTVQAPGSSVTTCSGEGVCTTVTTPGTTTYQYEGTCFLTPWVEPGAPGRMITPTAAPPAGNTNTNSPYRYYQDLWTNMNMGCSGTRKDFQFVCQQSPENPVQTLIYFRVPGYTHDRSSGKPIKYTWSRSQPRYPATTVTAGGIAGSLADIAMYYYDTDIRPTMPNTLPVPAAGASPLTDTNRFQHMTTYTMGLGVSGLLNYAPDYGTNPASVSDWSGLVAGTKIWPQWNWGAQNGGANDPRVDDLWHAAVNGRGRYYAANNVADVVQGLVNMVGSVVSVPVYGAPAGADKVQQTANGATFTNFFTAYWPTLWVGDLLVTPATIDASLGAPIASGKAVSASVALRNRIRYDSATGLWCDDRTMMLMAGSSTYDLLWDTPVKSGSGCAAGSSGTSLPGAIGSVNVSSALDASTSDKGYTGASAGDLVNWLRGSRAKEVSAPAAPGQLFRYRVDDKSNFMPMGDIVNGQPVYVGAPVFNYVENDYGTFKASNANRAARVYLAANDGFVHAFDPNPATGVIEKWALMPSSVVPEVYRTAAPTYATGHRFILDGAPVAADVYDSTAKRWRTLLVGGSRGGGSISGTSGFYAIDVTNPDAARPTPLWEFRRNPSDAACSGSTDVTNPNSGVYEACQLGFAYSTPVITKLATGQWVVMVASGYNNRDGKGHLYLLDAITGAQVARIDNNWDGKDTGPAPESGLAQVNAFITNPTVDNTARFAYGGDLNGNVWRYDLRTPDVSTSMRPTLLARLADTSGVAQPVTTLPEMQLSSNALPLVVVGTGQLFSDADRVSTQTHTLYGLVDSYGQNGTLPAALSRADLVQLAVSGSTVQVSGNAASTKGYALDMPGVEAGGKSAERLLINPVVIGGNLVFVTNAPSNDPCVAGGTSWLYTLNVQTGLPSAGAGQPARTDLSVSAVGLTVYVVGAQPVAQVTGANDTYSTPLAGNIQPFTGRRTAWREMR
jgi:type IV pilus assembly protein PilY1